MDKTEYYHVVSDLPKSVGQQIILDEEHPNGVYRRVYAQLDTVQAIYRHPEQYRGRKLSHEVDVALRELALEKVRKEKFPRYPSRMACLYVSRTFEEAAQWGDYFASLGRPTYGVARINADGRYYEGDAGKCFDGTVSEEDNLKMAEEYWLNGPNEDGREPIAEILVSGKITIVEIIKEINANLPE